MFELERLRKRPQPSFGCNRRPERNPARMEPSCNAPRASADRLKPGARSTSSACRSRPAADVAPMNPIAAKRKSNAQSHERRRRHHQVRIAVATERLEHEHRLARGVALHPLVGQRPTRVVVRSGAWRTSAPQRTAAGRLNLFLTAHKSCLKSTALNIALCSICTLCPAREMLRSASHPLAQPFTKAPPLGPPARSSHGSPARFTTASTSPMASAGGAHSIPLRSHIRAYAMRETVAGVMPVPTAAGAREIILPVPATKRLPCPCRESCARPWQCCWPPWR